LVLFGFIRPNRDFSARLGRRGLNPASRKVHRVSKRNYWLLQWLAAELSVAVDRGAGEIAIGHAEFGSASAAK
jgi:hypothetical protein